MRNEEGCNILLLTDFFFAYPAGGKNNPEEVQKSSLDKIGEKIMYFCGQSGVWKKCTYHSSLLRTCV